MRERRGLRLKDGLTTRHPPLLQQIFLSKSVSTEISVSGSLSPRGEWGRRRTRGLNEAPKLRWSDTSNCYFRRIESPIRSEHRRRPDVARSRRGNAKFRARVSLAYCQRWSESPLSPGDRWRCGRSSNEARGIIRNVGVLFYWRLLFEVQARRTVSPLSTHGLIPWAFPCCLLPRLGSTRGYSCRVKRYKIVAIGFAILFGGISIRPLSFALLFAYLVFPSSRAWAKFAKLSEITGSRKLPEITGDLLWSMRDISMLICRVGARRVLRRVKLRTKISSLGFASNFCESNEQRRCGILSNIYQVLSVSSFFHFWLVKI